MAALDVLNDAGASTGADAPMPFGATGMSGVGDSPLGALDVVGKVLDKDTPRRAYVAGALTPGNFGASMRGALTELNAAKDKEAELKERYIPIVDAALRQRKAMDMGYQNAALGSIAPLLGPGMNLNKDSAMQALDAAVKTGRVPAPYAQRLAQTLPDDPNELRQMLTGQVQSATDPYYYGQIHKPVALSPGASLVDPSTGNKIAGNDKWDVKEVNKGNKTELVAVNSADPSKTHSIGEYDKNLDPDAAATLKAAMYGHWVTRQNKIDDIAKDYKIAGMGPGDADTMAAKVLAVVQGRQPAPTVGSRAQGAQALLSAVYRAYPNVDINKLNLLPAHLKQWNDGNDGNVVRAFDTAVTHLELYQKAMAALKNGNILIFNRLKNEWANQVGAPEPGNARAFATGVAHETATALAKTNVGEQTREQYEKILKDWQSTAGSAGTVDAMQKLMVGQIQTLERQYQRPFEQANVDVPKFDHTFLGPTALELKEKLEKGMANASNATSPPRAPVILPPGTPPGGPPGAPPVGPPQVPPMVPPGGGAPPSRFRLVTPPVVDPGAGAGAGP